MVVAFEDEAAEVTVGEDAGEGALLGDDEQCAGSASEFLGVLECIADGAGLRLDGEVLADFEAENVGDAAEEAAEGAAGVALGEIILSECSASRDGEGEGVAHRERGGGGTGGGEDEVGGFGDSAEPDGGGGEAVEGVVLFAAGEGDDGDGVLAEDGNERDDFFCFA